jgi:nitrite reductase/ring-hydroxylating ferredoxin subunit
VDVAESVQDAVKALPQPVRNVLDGVWLGAPLHPALTDVPLGAWTAAAVLDAVGSEAADEVLAVGVLAALPAALTGLNDWSHLKEEPRRLGIVHALVNSGALTLNLGSLALRRRGHRRTARVLSGIGLLGSMYSAHVGGQLSFHHGVRVDHTAFEQQRERFAPVIDESELEDGKLHRVELEGVAVVLARREDGEVCAISAVCSHMGGPLDKGKREGDSVVCPWHGSRFDLCTGAVEEGPAVFPQPRWETRIRAGKVEIRAAKDE